MSDPYFQQKFSQRIGGIHYGKSSAIYKFEKIKRAKRQHAVDFPERELLDFGIGENDEVAAENVRATLKQEIDRWENRGYADNGIQEYKQAAARWMKREFAVDVDPDTEINHCMGSKTALAMLPLAFIDPGDYTLMTVPGYPIAGTYTKYCGGSVHALPLVRERQFQPDLESIPQAILERAKLLVLNYPNSPTGALATREFYTKVVDFARRHQLVVVQDAAHMMLSYSTPPLSFLSVPGAKEVGVEVHSMSKGFNMIGWRLGFVAGNSLLVRAFADIKDNSDSGQNIAIQKAAVEALGDSRITEGVRSKYHRRLNKLANTLRELGFSAEVPGGTYFLYTPAPKGLSCEQRFENAEEASQFLIRERGVCCVPWDECGPHLRFSVTYRADTEAAEDALMVRLRERLQSDRMIF